MQGGSQMSWNESLPTSRLEDLKGLVWFLEKEWAAKTNPTEGTDLAKMDQAIEILKQLVRGETFSEEKEILIRCKNQDALGYNAMQVKVNSQEVEIAQIFKFMSEKGIEKKRDRLYYLHRDGHYENYLGVWNGIWDVLSDMRQFLSSNNWKMSIEHKQ